jgi:hypothetical protein
LGSFTVGKLPAENKTPGSLRSRALKRVSSTLRFEADFEGDEDSSTAGKQSMAGFRILGKVLITRLVMQWIQSEN